MGDGAGGRALATHRCSVDTACCFRRRNSVPPASGPGSERRVRCCQAAVASRLARWTRALDSAGSCRSWVVQGFLRSRVMRPLLHEGQMSTEFDRRCAVAGQ